MAKSFQELRKSFDDYFEKNIPFPHNPKNLYEPCHYILNNSGKRIRPLLSLIAAQLFNDDINEDAYKAAMAIELFHNFTLVHDDIMDNAPLRRGKATIHEHFGNTAGILSGDVMNIYSYKCLSSISPQYLPQILDLFNQTAIEVCEGQQLDMDYESKNDLTESDYIEMIRLKTSVLIGCGLKAGAILGGASPAEADNLYKIGIYLGLAFQIQDDYLDTFGDEKMTGKKVGGDIMANKNTYLFIKAKVSNQESDVMTLNEIIKDNNHSKIDKMIAFYQQSGIDEEAKNKINYYFEKAMKGIEMIDNENGKKTLYELVNALIKRQY